MPKIANQDYIRLDIKNPSNLTEDEKRKIWDLHDRGILMDTLLVQNDGDCIMRVLTDTLGAADEVSVIDGTGNIVKMDVSLA